MIQSIHGFDSDGCIVDQGSKRFDDGMSGEASQRRALTSRTSTGLKEKVKEALQREDWKEVSALWMKLRES
jgi:hypothetical protein